LCDLFFTNQRQSIGVFFVSRPAGVLRNLQKS
jgi:hypothetical protein